MRGTIAAGQNFSKRPLGEIHQGPVQKFSALSFFLTHSKNVILYSSSNRESAHLAGHAMPGESEVKHGSKERHS
jgi:hypothetical protein